VSGPFDFDDEVRHVGRERPLFELGRVVATPGAIAVMVCAGINAAELLDRHVRGDWGDVPAEDARENELALREGFRILSAYGDETRGERLWIITEADRSVTTILRPEDY